jgi:hypothetical protein
LSCGCILLTGRRYSGSSGASGKPDRCANNASHREHDTSRRSDCLRRWCSSTPPVRPAGFQSRLALSALNGGIQGGIAGPRQAHEAANTADLTPFKLSKRLPPDSDGSGNVPPAESNTPAQHPRRTVSGESRGDARLAILTDQSRPAGVAGSRKSHKEVCDIRSWVFLAPSSRLFQSNDSEAEPAVLE